jgi:hypothetical protein
MHVFLNLSAHMCYGGVSRGGGEGGGGASWVVGGIYIHTERLIQNKNLD